MGRSGHDSEELDPDSAIDKIKNLLEKDYLIICRDANLDRRFSINRSILDEDKESKVDYDFDEGLADGDFRRNFSRKRVKRIRTKIRRIIRKARVVEQEVTDEDTGEVTQERRRIFDAIRPLGGG